MVKLVGLVIFLMVLAQEVAEDGPPVARSKWMKGESKAVDLNRKIQQKHEGDTTRMTKSKSTVVSVIFCFCC